MQGCLHIMAALKVEITTKLTAVAITHSMRHYGLAHQRVLKYWSIDDHLPPTLITMHPRPTGHYGCPL